MTQYTKNLGYAAEQLVADHYRQQGFSILNQNYTIRGGEIDIIAQDDKNIVFIEVKNINSIDDINGFITRKKVYYLDKTIQHFLYTNNIPEKINIRLDLAFVRNNSIVEIFTNIDI